MSLVNLESLMAAKEAFFRSRSVDEGSKLEGLHVDGCRAFASPSRVAVDGSILFFSLRSFIVSNPWFLSRSAGRPGFMALVPLVVYFAAGFAVDASSFTCYTQAFCSATAVGEEMRKAYAAHAPADDILLAAATRVAALPIASAFVDVDQRRQRRVELKGFLTEVASQQRQVHLEAKRGGGGGEDKAKGVLRGGGAQSYGEEGGGEEGSSGEGWGFSGPEGGVERTWEVSFGEGEAWGEGFEQSTALEREGWMSGGVEAAVGANLTTNTALATAGAAAEHGGGSSTAPLPSSPSPPWGVEESQSPFDMLFGATSQSGTTPSPSGGDRRTALNSPHPLGYEVASNVPSYYRRKARRDALQQMK